MHLPIVTRLGLVLCLTIVVRAAEIIPYGSEWRYRIGYQEASDPIDAWRQVGFDDTSWDIGTAPIGYGEPVIVTSLPATPGEWQSVYFRKTFQLSNPANLSELTLKVLIDDGYVVWINGHELEPRYNVPGGDLAYNAPLLGGDWPFVEPLETTLVVSSNLSTILRSGENVLCIHGFNCNTGSSDFVVDAELSGSIDVVPPTVVDVIPTANATIRTLTAIEVAFSEAVTGVDAADLLVNGSPAVGLAIGDPTRYVFSFPAPPAGTVQVSWAAAHGIRDLASTPNAFVGGSWSYTVDPSAQPPGVIISEFMADNDRTLRDEDGESSDWIELYNAGASTANLAGWFLTDTTNKLARWRIPSITLLPNQYVVIFASGKDRRDPAAPLHTDFKLSSSPAYLALSDRDTNVVSEFHPTYPAQQEDISYGRDRSDPRLLGYFTTPTPGAANVPGGPGFAPDVQFSRPGGTFSSTFPLTLSCPSPDAVIRYSLGTNLPTEASAVYTGPITISGTTIIRARAYQNGLLPSPVRTETYMLLSDNVLSVSSDLPIVILHNLGKGGVPVSEDQFVAVQVFEPRWGPSKLTNAPDFSGHGIFHKRGSSTLWMNKASFFLEIRDEQENDRDVSLANLPEESDWVLYAPNSFEPVLIHNPVAFELSRQMGPYASRTRFVELYLKDDSGTPGPVSAADYNGVYVLQEKIKVGKNRVAIDKLRPENVTAPRVSGGYLLSIDRGPQTFYAANASMNFLDPDTEEMAQPQRSAQVQYISSYFNTFYDVLTGPNWTDPTQGYAAYIDVPSWIDHHIHGVVTFNVDALRLSGYFYKPREGKIEMGPVWDFDRTQGSTDGRDFNPRIWRSTVPDYGTDMFNADYSIFHNPWYSRLFTDIDFWQKWVDRYQELRANVLANTNVYAVVDRQANEVRPAQTRETARWSDTRPRSGTRSSGGYSYTFPGTYQGEVDFMKLWYSNRLDFIDTNLLARPRLSLPGGPVASGTLRTLSPASKSGSWVVYTLDGVDPRQTGGAVTSLALSNNATVMLVITNNVRLVARSLNANHRNLTGANMPPLSTPWSGAIDETFVVRTPPLLISEIMFHPENAPAGNTNNADNFEFIELLNAGTNTLDLANFRLSGAIRLTLSRLALAPGERAVVICNPAAFESRYGSGIRIAGTYTNQLDNAGESLLLTGPLGEPIHDFRYAPDWHPITDGHGFSLVLVDEQPTITNLPITNNLTRNDWRPSSARGGSPGAAEPAAPAFPRVLIQEALTHTDPPLLDTIELGNAGTADADLSGWFLTDDFNDPKKFRIPAGTVLAPGHYALFDENDFNPTPGVDPSFSLSESGEEIYLFSADADGNLTGYVHGYSFGAAFPGVSFGRHVNSLGTEYFVAQTALSLGTNNAGPLIGPVVINEILYHPPPIYGTNDNTRDEYVELHNLSNTNVPLFDPGHPTNTWHLRGGVDFDLPPALTLPAGGYLLLVNFDPQLHPGELAAFRSLYALGTAVTILGPYQGKLDNEGETVKLTRPGAPEVSGQVPYVLVDQVDYSNVAPWPTNANATGLSLQRLPGRRFGNDPAHWQVATPTPASANPGGEPDPDRDGDGLPNDWETAYNLDPDSALGADGAGGDPDGDGLTNLQEYISGTHPRDPSSYLRVESILGTGLGAEVHFTAVAGVTYSVLYCDDLESGAWAKLADVPAPVTTQEVVVQDSGASPAGQRYYRLVTPPVP